MQTDAAYFRKMASKLHQIAQEPVDDTLEASPDGSGSAAAASTAEPAPAPGTASQAAAAAAMQVDAGHIASTSDADAAAKSKRPAQMMWTQGAVDAAKKALASSMALATANSEGACDNNIFPNKAKKGAISELDLHPVANAANSSPCERKCAGQAKVQITAGFIEEEDLADAVGDGDRNGSVRNTYTKQKEWSECTGTLRENVSIYADIVREELKRDGDTFTWSINLSEEAVEHGCNMYAAFACFSRRAGEEGKGDSKVYHIKVKLTADGIEKAVGVYESYKLIGIKQVGRSRPVRNVWMHSGLPLRMIAQCAGVTEERMKK